MTDIVEKMEELARKWHEGQFRRGPERLPYIVHPEAVVARLRQWGYDETADAATLAVAWGHDLLEDTKCSETEILAAGGAEVLAGIKALTFKLPKYPRLTDEEFDARKDEYLHQVARTAAPEILIVKMADRFCNTMDFVRAGNSWAAEYSRLGECLFERAREMKHAAEVSADWTQLRHLAADDSEE